jgi:hypothetical protein
LRPGCTGCIITGNPVLVPAAQVCTLIFGVMSTFSAALVGARKQVSDRHSRPVYALDNQGSPNFISASIASQQDEDHALPVRIERHNSCEFIRISSCPFVAPLPSESATRAGSDLLKPWWPPCGRMVGERRVCLSEAIQWGRPTMNYSQRKGLRRRCQRQNAITRTAHARLAGITSSSQCSIVQWLFST